MKLSWLNLSKKKNYGVTDRMRGGGGVKKKARQCQIGLSIFYFTLLFFEVSIWLNKPLGIREFDCL